jgi:hypothetical protein
MVDYLSKKPKLSFVDDPREVYKQRSHATQAKVLETLDPKAEAEGSSESPKETQPPSPKRDLHQPPPMGEQPHLERRIKLCNPDIVDLPIINLQDTGRPFKIKVSTICMVQHSSFTSKEDPNLHLQAFVQLCQTFDENGVTQDETRARIFPFSLLGKALRWFHTLPAELKQDWEALMRNFMKEFYLPTKNESLRNKIDTLFNPQRRLLRKLWSISMNTCESNSLNGVSVYLRGGWRRWR